MRFLSLISLSLLILSVDPILAMIASIQRSIIAAPAMSEKSTVKEVSIVGLTDGQARPSDKKALLDLLSQCANSDTPVSCLFPLDGALMDVTQKPMMAAIEQNVDIEEILVACYAHRYAVGLMGELCSHVHAQKFKQGSLSFCTSAPVPPTVHLLKSGRGYTTVLYRTARKLLIAKQERLKGARNRKALSVKEAASGFPDTVDGLDALLSKNSSLRSHFFASGNGFDQLQAIWPDFKGKNLTLSELLSRCSKENKALGLYAQSLEDGSPLKARILKTVSTAEYNLLERIPKEVTALGYNLDTTTFFDLLMGLIKKKQSIFEGCHDHDEIYRSFMMWFEESLELKRISELLETSDRVLYIAFNPGMSQLRSHLRKAPFQAHSYGETLSSHFLSGPKPFNPDELRAIFASLFSESVYGAKTNKVELLDGKEPQTNSLCSFCSEEYMRWMSDSPDKKYCDASCFFLSTLIEKKSLQCPALLLLNESAELSQDQQTMLARSAALVRYFYYLLANFDPSSDRSALYKMRQKPVAEHLKRISACAASVDRNAETQSWSDALTFVACFGVDCKKLSIFLILAAQLKKDFLNALLENAGAHSYKQLEEAKPIAFDPDSKLFKQQYRLMCFLAEQLSFPVESEMPQQKIMIMYLQLSQLYEKLLSLLLKRLGKTDLKYESILQTRLDVAPTPLPADLLELFSAPERAEKKFKLVKKAKPYRVKEQSKSQHERPAASPAAVRRERPVKLAVAAWSCDETDTRPFIEVVAKKKRPAILKQFHEYFHGVVPYQVKLYKAQAFFEYSERDNEACRAWASNASFRYAERIKMLFALYYQDEHESIDETPEHGLLLTLPASIGNRIDGTIASKLDLHHLFAEEVDGCLTSCGIIEKKVDQDNPDSIQITIPGEICRGANLPVVGFFQYTFKRVAGEWVCVHRCFRYYNSSLDHKHVSIPLRRALYRYLLEHYGDCEEYAGVIAELARIVQ